MKEFIKWYDAGKTIEIIINVSEDEASQYPGIIDVINLLKYLSNHIEGVKLLEEVDIPK